MNTVIRALVPSILPNVLVAVEITYGYRLEAVPLPGWTGYKKVPTVTTRIVGLVIVGA